MGQTVAVLQEIMSAEEFDRWKEFDFYYPLDDQANFHVPIAGLHAAVLNVNRGPNTRAVELEECLHYKRAASDEEVEAKLRQAHW